MALDWDDVGGYQPVGRVDDLDLDVVYGWGHRVARQRKVIDYHGDAFPVHINRNGWRLLVASAPRDRVDTDTHCRDPVDGDVGPNRCIAIA